MNTDSYLNKQYDKRNYNCAHFVSEVWLDLFGYDLSIQLQGFMTERCKRNAKLSELRKLKKIYEPKSPCIVWLHSKNISHVGIYIEGRILHITEDGVKYELLETLKLGFKKASFYEIS